MPAVLPGLRGRRGLARLCAGLAVVGVVVAAGRPSVEVEPEGRMLELVVDVSNSTHADDLSPTRLGAIQQASLHLLGRVDGEVRVAWSASQPTRGHWSGPPPTAMRSGPRLPDSFRPEGRRWVMGSSGPWTTSRPPARPAQLGY